MNLSTWVGFFAQVSSKSFSNMRTKNFCSRSTPTYQEILAHQTESLSCQVHVLVLFHNFTIIFTVFIFWRAHVDNVTAVTILDESKMVVTASLDCTVRMWTLDGEYVGMLEQPVPCYSFIY